MSETDFRETWSDENGSRFYLRGSSTPGMVALLVEHEIAGELYALEIDYIEEGNREKIADAQADLQFKVKIKRMVLGDIPGDGRMIYELDEAGSFKSVGRLK